MSLQSCDNLWQFMTFSVLSPSSRPPFGFRQKNLLRLFSASEVIFLLSEVIFIREEKQHKHKLSGPEFPQTFLTLTPGTPLGQKVSHPITGAAEKSAPLVRTSTIFCAGRPRPEGFSKKKKKKNFVQKKFALIFWLFFWRFSKSTLP